MITERTKTLELLRNYSESVKPNDDDGRTPRSSHVSATLFDHQLLPPSTSEENQVGGQIHLGPRSDWHAYLPSLTLTNEEVEFANKYMNNDLEIKSANVMENSLEKRYELYEAQDTTDRRKFVFWSTLLTVAILILGFFWVNTSANRNALVITNPSNDIQSAEVVSGIEEEVRHSETVVPEVSNAIVENQTDYDCAIILGAFANQNNVDRMISHLEEMGYSAYTEVRGNLTLVGAKALSSDRQALKELRQSINREAWYIHFE